MARPPLALGKHGSIHVTRDGRQWVARCRFRQPQWPDRPLRALGIVQDCRDEQPAGRVARPRRQAPLMLSADARFADAAEIYLAKIAERRENSTYGTYRHWINKAVLPALGQLRIHECDVAQLDAYFHHPPAARVRSKHPANAPDHRRGNNAAGAVLHKAAPSNPVRELERIGEPKGKRKAQPRALTIEERRRLLGWLDGTSNDPQIARKQAVARAADLPDLIRLCSARACVSVRCAGFESTPSTSTACPWSPVMAYSWCRSSLSGARFATSRARAWCAATQARLRPRCGSSRCPDSSPSGYAPGSQVTKTRCGRCSPQLAPTVVRHSGGIQRAAQCPRGPHGGWPRLDDPAHLAAHLRHDPPRRIRPVG
jgi:hypothetical protein